MARADAQGFGLTQSVFGEAFRTADGPAARDAGVEKSLHKDNPNYGEIQNLNRYMRILDRRLSMPKHTRKEYDPEEDTAVPQTRRSVVLD